MKSLLCLPVNADEILASELVNFQFFVVDCRPAEQYNSGSDFFVKNFSHYSVTSCRPLVKSFPSWLRPDAAGPGTVQHGVLGLACLPTECPYCTSWGWTSGVSWRWTTWVWCGFQHDDGSVQVPPEAFKVHFCACWWLSKLSPGAAITSPERISGSCSWAFSQ